jgi:AmmeMemoRadiSam system protein B
VYAETWKLAEESLRDVEIIVILGTDHAGPRSERLFEEIGYGEITLTRQNYHTPLGTLQTSQQIVDTIATAIGDERAFVDELNHRAEHSIELAMVWLQYFLGENRPQIVPILCGSYHRFTQGEAHPDKHESPGKFMNVLSQALDGRRVVVVAAADLAHVGPAFGDELAFREEERSDLERADSTLLDAIASGSSGASAACRRSIMR